MNYLLRSISPNRTLFFNQFDKAVKNVVEMARILNDAVNSESRRFSEEVVKQIKKRENLCDDITHKIHLSLDKIFFAPLNRDNIHALAACIDEVADTINEAGARIYLFNVDCFSHETQQMAEIVLKATTEIEKAVMLLRSPQQAEELPQLCRLIKSYEKQSDQLYYRGVAKIFSDEKNPVYMLKHREILQSLESAVNKCRNVTDVLNQILISR